jgi:tRNA (cmo5U34)-methyltransferase
MSVFNEERARTYDHGARTYMPGYEALHETARHSLTAFLDRNAPARVLLLGVGTGYEAEQLLQFCPQWTLIGVDPSAPMLEVAQQRVGSSVELRTGVLQDFPDLTELDAVLSIGVVHHLGSREQQVALINELGRRVRPGGALLVGCQVGPYAADSARGGALKSRWRELGMSPQEVEERMRLFLSQTLPPTPTDLQTWYADAGFSPPEPLFTTGYFRLLAAQRTAQPSRTAT